MNIMNLYILGSSRKPLKPFKVSYFQNLSEWEIFLQRVGMIQINTVDLFDF